MTVTQVYLFLIFMFIIYFYILGKYLNNRKKKENYKYQKKEREVDDNMTDSTVKNIEIIVPDKVKKKGMKKSTQNEDCKKYNTEIEFGKIKEVVVKSNGLYEKTNDDTNYIEVTNDDSIKSNNYDKDPNNNPIELNEIMDDNPIKSNEIIDDAPIKSNEIIDDDPIKSNDDPIRQNNSIKAIFAKFFDSKYDRL